MGILDVLKDAQGALEKAIEELDADRVAGSDAVTIFDWFARCERLAVAGSDPRIQIWNVAANRKVATLEGHAQQVTTLTFHPDGELLASHGWDGQLLLWHPSSGRQLMRLTTLRSPHFSADGRWLGITRDGDRTDLLEVTPTREYRTLVSSVGAGQGSFGYCGDISPDGRLLVVGMDQGARLWDLRTGRELAALPARTPFAFFYGSGPARLAGPIPPSDPGWGLLTSGSDGLLRWPATCDDPAGGTCVSARRGTCPPWAGPGLRTGRTAARWRRRPRKGAATKSWTWKREWCGGTSAATPKERSRPSAGTAAGPRAAAGTRTASGSGTSARVNWPRNGSSARTTGSTSRPTAAP